MLKKIRFSVIFPVLAALVLIAAQCNPHPTEIPSAKEKSIVEGQEQGTVEAAAESPKLAPVSLGAGEKLKVVATTNIVADIVRQVGGDMIDLTPLLPAGSDPHSFQVTPRDLANVAETQLVFANGMGLEAFLDEVLKNAGGEAALVQVSQGVEARGMETKEEHKEEAEEHAYNSDVDPHTWTSPANVVIFVNNIEQALSALDPANAATYRANAENYRHQLAELDVWVKTQIETIPAENRKLVTDHAVFGYYADRYGLEQIGSVIPAITTAAEPSAKELADLENAIGEYKVKAVFVGNTVNPALSEQVAQDTGTRLLTLYTGSLGPAGSGVESYLDYIRYNTDTIVRGLK
jgi:ABC-type Zn uptake system ZnuABC Zn-binding protein ZnuA